MIFFNESTEFVELLSQPFSIFINQRVILDILMNQGVVETPCFFFHQVRCIKESSSHLLFTCYVVDRMCKWCYSLMARPLLATLFTSAEGIGFANVEYGVGCHVLVPLDYKQLNDIVFNKACYCMMV